MFLALLIAYPHLAYFFSCRYANSALGAQASLRVDAVLVGMLVVVNQFHFLATVSFVAALVMSILLIAAVRGLWLNLTLLVMTTLVGYWWLSWAGTDRIAAPEPEENLLKTWLSGLFILTYSATAAALGFKVSRHLGQGRKQLAAYQAKIDDLSMRLQRYVSPQIYQGIINDDLEVTRRRCLSVTRPRGDDEVTRWPVSRWRWRCKTIWLSYAVAGVQKESIATYIAGLESIRVIVRWAILVPPNVWTTPRSVVP